MADRLCNLDDLRKIGFAANRRLLRVQRISHHCQLGAEVFDGLHRPAVVDDRRVSALRFGDPRVQALLATLLAFRLQPMGFANRELREHTSPLLGWSIDAYGAGRATYDLRRLRGLIERIPHSHRYRVTDEGLHIALCYQRVQRRALCPALSAVFDGYTCLVGLRRSLARLIADNGIQNNSCFKPFLCPKKPCQLQFSLRTKEKSLQWG